VKRGPDDGGIVRLRLQEIAVGHDLDVAVVARFEHLLRCVSSDPRAPTSVTDPEQAADIHIADSLSALPLIDAEAPARIADVGSGAGFPGVPLAIARPQLEVDLVEAAGRKTRFLEDLVAAVGLDRVRVVNGRVEDWGGGEGREAYDVVLIRAVATLPILLEYAAPLLRDRGVLIAWKGRRSPMPETAAAAELLGMQPDRVIPAQPYPASRDRHLHVYRRVRPVPESFPRRPGMARKRPLGGGSSPE
jgi:16S rRNA (guanine527-N7)-methyltransferase